ncbi:hypothetical protein [Flavobacterium yafengii]|uniref:hypothetical protein n=1 Tax=Flavobacterium yafengii TaxID=3041253 RepID=UPI0024A9C7EA|nr:hypothetical protein [Flavobacterium yafengii]MDI5898397.1 hypothetical protein [Flavobacterium yafengii]
MIDRIKRQEDKQYQREFHEFLYKNPNATEDFYINYRIRITEKLLVEYENTADFIKGEELDGKELVNGILITTKTGTASEHIMFYKEVVFLKGKLKQLEALQKASEINNEKETTFLTGLKFATGEAQELYKKSKISFEKLAINLGFKNTDRPYFSATINNNRGIKNLYNNPKVVIQIYNYCVENKTVMCEEFLSKHHQIEPK